MQAYYFRFDDVDGLAALGLSRAFRKQTAVVRELQPSNIEARRMEIRYLYQAPRIAGGSRSKGEKLIAELERIDSSEAYLARLEVGPFESDGDAMIALLNEKPIAAADELGPRSSIVRKLILTIENYRAADAEMATWDAIELPAEIEVERMFLRGVLRVLGGFEPAAAEAYLTEFVARRVALADDIMEPVSRGYAYLGDARRSQNKLAGAREAYEAALKLDADDRRAKNGLAELE